MQPIWQIIQFTFILWYNGMYVPYGGQVGGGLDAKVMVV